MQHLWHVSLWIPESEGGHEHPDDGYLIQQLSNQTEGAVEVDGPQTHDHQKGPHDMDTLSDASGVRTEQVDEERWYDEEQGIAELQRQEHMMKMKNRALLRALQLRKEHMMKNRALVSYNGKEHMMKNRALVSYNGKEHMMKNRALVSYDGKEHMMKNRALVSYNVKEHMMKNRALVSYNGNNNNII